MNDRIMITKTFAQLKKSSKVNRNMEINSLVSSIIGGGSMSQFDMGTLLNIGESTKFVI